MQFSPSNLEWFIDALRSTEELGVDGLHKLTDQLVDRQLRDYDWKQDLWLWTKGPWTVGRETAIYLENYL